MSSPVSTAYHGQPHSIINGWLVFYLAKVPELILADNATTELDVDNVPQPDLLLALPESAGGKAHLTEASMLAGAPELVVEIASTSASIDLNAKFNAYRRNAIGEYLVWRTRDQAFDWFILHEGLYQRLEPDPADNLYKSPTFPGLWLDHQALFHHDLSKLAAVVQRGCQTQAHAAFTRQLQKA